ncbi:metalloprotease [Mycobacterium phage Zimmer]|nr:metalloprotease [Mycobacterium phage Zimmer]
MGGRGTGGGPGPGSGKSKAKKSAGSLSGGGSSSGGSGGSAGSSGGGGKGNSGAGTGGVTGGGGAGGQAGGGSGTTVNNQHHTLDLEFASDLTDVERAREQEYMRELPQHLKDVLAKRGTRVFVGGRADESPGWADLAKDTGWKSDTLTADGREIGTLSFYLPNRNEVYISSRSPHGSVNVYVHELGHALDFHYIDGGGRQIEFPPGSGDFETVHVISDDPRFRSMHRKYILNNTKVRKYYRTGSQGTAKSGREESVAEGMAEYQKYGREGLINLFHSAAAADAWIAIMKDYGVIK